MAEQLVPILKVADTARAAAAWYARLGFVEEFEHRYSDEFPGYAGVKKGEIEIHLSEHPGDATPDTLLYYWIDDVQLVAKEFGVELIEQSGRGPRGPSHRPRRQPRTLRHPQRGLITFGRRPTWAAGPATSLVPWSSSRCGVHRSANGYAARDDRYCTPWLPGNLTLGP